MLEKRHEDTMDRLEQTVMMLIAIPIVIFLIGCFRFGLAWVKPSDFVLLGGFFASGLSIYLRRTANTESKSIFTARQVLRVFAVTMSIYWLTSALGQK